MRIVAVDFTNGQSVYEDIQSEISDLDVAVLGITVIFIAIFSLFNSQQCWIESQNARSAWKC